MLSMAIERNQQRGAGGRIILPETKKLETSQSYFIVEKESGKVVERLSTGGKRVLRSPGLEDRSMVEGIEKGFYEVRSQDDIIGSYPLDKTGIGITGGGDCAGISDFLASFKKGLDPKYLMLGVKFAGKGLSASPDQFREQLIVVDDLAAKEFEGRSSTPYGSARVDPLKVDKGDTTRRDNTRQNIDGRGFFYGTGGNDHLGLLERVAKEFPDMIVVGTFKSIDGDGFINGKPAQMLGFDSAKVDYRKAIYAAAQNAATHQQWHVVETFGRGAGKLAFEAARRHPSDLEGMNPEERRKIEDYGDGVMILVPEKQTTFRSVAEEASSKRKSEGFVVVVAAEGFIPPELKHEMDRLAKDADLKEKWKSGELKAGDIPKLIEVVDEGDPRSDLRRILGDQQLAAQFGEMTWNSKLDDHGNVAKISGIGNFITGALKILAQAEKVNQIYENYEARGATPTEYDTIMGQKIGTKMAELVNDGVTGGKAVIYYEGMDARTQEPVVVDLVGVSDENNLNNPKIYHAEMLQENGVFWKKQDLTKYGMKIAA